MHEAHRLSGRACVCVCALWGMQLPTDRGGIPTAAPRKAGLGLLGFFQRARHGAKVTSVLDRLRDNLRCVWGGGALRHLFVFFGGGVRCSLGWSTPLPVPMNKMQCGFLLPLVLVSS
jgi:hypothetical protein